MVCMLSIQNIYFLKYVSADNIVIYMYILYMCNDNRSKKEWKPERSRESAHIRVTERRTHGETI